MKLPVFTFVFSVLETNRKYAKRCQTKIDFDQTCILSRLQFHVFSVLFYTHAVLVA